MLLARDTMNNIDAIGNRNVGCNKGMGNWYSLDKQVAMGRAYSQQVEHGAKMINDPVVTEYVNRVGQNLVRNSDAKVPFTIKVIDTDEINAFALPGGFFYVNSGLILAADNEAELAGVMAHEIAHVAACHVAREQTRSNIVNLASIPLIFVPGGWAIYEGTQAAHGHRRAADLHEVLAQLRGGSRLPGHGIHVQGGLRSAVVHLVLREDRSAGEEEARHAGQGFLFASDDARSRSSGAEGNATVLPARPEYIVDTSEFEQVKSRLASIENRHKVTERPEQQGPSDAAARDRRQSVRWQRKRQWQRERQQQRLRQRLERR